MQTRGWIRDSKYEVTLEGVIMEAPVVAFEPGRGHEVLGGIFFL